MKKPVLFYGAIILAALLMALGIYYLIPGIYHPFIFIDHPLMGFINHAHLNYNAHKKFTAVFFALALLAILAAYLTRPRRSGLSQA